MNLSKQGAPSFDLREFVPQEVWKQYGEKSIWFLDERLFPIMESIRTLIRHEIDKDAIIHINTWMYGANRNWSGLRTAMYIADLKNSGKPVATLSQHIMGRAIDFKCFANGKEISSSQIRALILANEDFFIQLGLSTLEGDKLAPTWVHLDCRNTGLDKITVF